MTGDLWDLGTERAFLGAVWHSAGKVLSDTEIVEDDFQHWPHRRLWAAFSAMWAEGAPFDLATVRQHCGDDFPRVNEALVEIVSSGVVGQSANWHANVLMRLTAHRRAVEAATRITQIATGEMEADELAEFARQQIDQATADRGLVPAETWEQQLDRAQARWRTPVTDAIKTHWDDLDELLSGGGLRPGHLTVIGARPGVGKSLVATVLAGRAAATGHGVYFASVEMSSEELTDRIAAAASMIPLSDLTNRTLTDDQVRQMEAALSRIRHWPLTIDDRVSSVAHVKRGVRTASRDPRGLGLVIVDYLQLMEPAEKGGRTPRHEQVAGMSRAMKLLAREFSVPVVLLSQLNRNSTQRESRQPVISDLRESGAVEQDADEIILLHRDDDDADLAGHIQLHLAKNRHGSTGYVRLRFRPQISRIENAPYYGVDIA